MSIEYYPYLRAARYDVIALERSAATLVSNGKIRPILEPVKVRTSSLVKRAQALAAAGLGVGLVMNPRVGELVGNPAATTQLLADLRGQGATVVPALIVDDTTTAADLSAFSVHAQGGESLFVHHGVAATQQLVTQLHGTPRSTHLFLDGAVGTSYVSNFQPQQRALLRDGFQAQVRNASYPPRSFFSDLHQNYRSQGWGGFGDFATIGFRFSDSGGPAYAVAIHMTEHVPAQGVCCNHFLSTSNLTQANPGGKFGEAVAALSAYSQANPGQLDFSSACQELLQLHATGHFPGLGEVKRLSIQHHLELMARLV